MRALLLLALATPAALAQPTRMDMPEGTYDAFVGFTITERNNQTMALPWLAVQWANGVFLTLDNDDGLGLGLHMSDYPSYDYGPLLTANSKDQRSDTAGDRRGVAAQGGAFFNWHIDHSVDLGTQLAYGGGNDRRGVTGQVVLRLSSHLASHHDATLSVGTVLANQAYLQSYFGVNPAQAAAGGNPVFQPRAGVLSAFVSTEWEWQFANKLWLYTGFRYSRLGAVPAASPLVDQRTHLSAHMAFAYHY